MLNGHLFLIGMPGCGKSSLSKKVASQLNLPHLDVDTCIQQAAHCTVSEFFQRYGEQAFRLAETNVLIELTRAESCLVSTGGGTPMREINRAIMRNHGSIILIDRPLEQILGDIKLDRRPLLAQKGLGEVERLYWERIDTYRAAADYVLDNRGSYYDGVNALEQLIRSHFSL